MKDHQAYLKMKGNNPSWAETETNKKQQHRKQQNKQTNTSTKPHLHNSNTRAQRNTRASNKGTKYDERECLQDCVVAHGVYYGSLFVCSIT